MTWGIVAGAAIGAVGSIVASNKSSSAQKKGIKAQNALLGPWSNAGMNALPAVQSFVDNGANYADTQAYKDITNSAKASGMSLSGNRLTALTDYYATNFRPQRMNELMAIPTLGQAAAAGQAANLGNLYSAQGQTQAAGILGATNSVQSGLNNWSFMNSYNQNQNAGVQSGVTNLLNQPGMF